MPEKVNNVDIRLGEKDLDSLQTMFKTWIEQVQDTRRTRMEKVWTRAARNYEGEAKTQQLPWRGASNAVLNITQSHADSIQARLYAAGATSDPVYIVKPSTTEPVLVDEAGEELVSATKFALWWQEISKHVEKYEVNHSQAIEDASWYTALYGDAWIYIAWVKDEVMDVRLDKTGKELVRTPRVLIDQPVLTVLHPQDVFLAPWDDDPQTARTIGFQFDLDEHDLLIRERKKIYPKARVKELKTLLSAVKEAGSETSLQKSLRTGGYYREWDGAMYTKSELEKKLAEDEGIDPSASPNALRMVKVFQRVDLDGDGIPEEIQFEAEKNSGTVAVARYHNLLHNQRPLIHLYFNRRVGSPNNQGVPEMLFNAQKILNSLMRDLLNNNKIKNTKLFLGRVGSPIKKQSEIFPSRLLMVNDIDKDFKVLDLGASSGVTGIQEITLIQAWAERLTGVSDANLGIEKKSRTPVGTTQALLEQGSKRLDRIIDRMRDAQRDMWAQVLCLYRQNADPRKLAQLAAIEAEDMPLFLRAWAKVKPEDLTSFLVIKPEVSSDVFNRAAQKQELLTVMGQIQQWYQQLIQLAQLAAGSGAIDPATGQAIDTPAREMFLQMAKGGHELMQKFLSLHDVKEQDNLNPEALIKLLEQVTTIAEQQPGNANSQPGSPAQAAQSAASNGADPGESGEADGRPVPGLPRIPDQTGTPAV